MVVRPSAPIPTSTWSRPLPAARPRPAASSTSRTQGRRRTPWRPRPARPLRRPPGTAGSIILSPVDEAGVPRLGCMRIGPPLLFEPVARHRSASAVLNDCSPIATSRFPSNAPVFLHRSAPAHGLRLRSTTSAGRDDYRIDPASVSCSCIASTGPHGLARRGTP